MEASSQEAALRVLGTNGLFVTILEAAGERPIYARRIKLFDRVGARELMMFSRQLSVMFQSRVSLVEALEILGSQTRSPMFKEKIFQISSAIEGGTPFSDALANHPDAFSSFYVNMVKSGEASGTLSDVLNYLAEHMEREYQLSSKIKSAMIYPAFVLFLSFAVLFLMMFFVIPNLTRVLEETGQELPAVTKAVMGLAAFTRGFWWLIFLAIGGSMFGILQWRKTKEGRRFFSEFSLRVPLLAPFLRMVYLSRFAENLATLIAGGLPIVQSLDITSQIVGNDVYQDIIQEAKVEVQKGNSISAVLQQHPLEFPPVFTQMVFVGEKSGTMDKTLANIVGFYQKEVERQVDAFLSILEPLFIVILGVIIGGLMASVLLPLYQMSAA